MPRIAADGRKMLAEQTSGANSVLADRLKGEALDDLKTARACIEVLQPLVVTFPSSGLSASKKVLRMQKVTAGVRWLGDCRSQYRSSSPSYPGERY
jgi:hypothetical protein